MRRDNAETTDAHLQPRELTPEQQKWARHAEGLWRTAHRIAAADPKHDPSDVYHALRALERTPTQRLRAALQRGRLRTHGR